MSTLLMVVVREVGLIILGWGMMRLTPSGRAGYRGEDTLNTSGRVQDRWAEPPTDLGFWEDLKTLDFQGFRVWAMGGKNLGFGGFWSSGRPGGARGRPGGPGGPRGGPNSGPPPQDFGTRLAITGQQKVNFCPELENY